MKSREWVVTICVVVVASAGAVRAAGIAGGSETAEFAMRWLEEGLDGMDSVSSESGGFPFQISGSKFLLNGEEVFLNIIGYQPLAPGQGIGDEINRNRVRDDLRRWRAYQGGTEPVVVRLYPGPGDNDPNWRMPRDFYDGIRELGFWIIRDIFFDQDLCDWEELVEKGQNTIDAVLAEVNEANALDLIFAWEIGNEFPNDEIRTPCWDAGAIKQFIENMCGYLKDEIGKLEPNDVSSWVTWGSYPPYDPLYSDGNPVEPNSLDYISYNAYSYWPDRIRDHQAGLVTGTAYQGYLAALKAEYPNEPLVISETGLSDSNEANVQGRYHPWYPEYRYGGLNPEQVAEGLAERYWDARMLCDANDANIVIAGLSIFEWNDEWHKGSGSASDDNNLPEEHFGLGYFAEDANLGRYQLRYKLQQEVIRDLYTLRFNNDANIIDSVAADSNTLEVDANTWVRAVVSDSAAKPVRLRWEASRGYIIGDPNAVYDANRLGEPNSVKFYSGKTWLGPARITVVAVDANGNVGTGTTTINIETSEPNGIEILTVGVGVNLSDPSVKASGRVSNVNLDEYKLVCYIFNWHWYIQPYGVMKFIWIDSTGYWWTKITNARNNPGELHCWLVPVSYDPPAEVEDPNWKPSYAIAEANTVVMDVNGYNDVDNDLLPDYWEVLYFGSIEVNDRYADFDNDGAHNLEEFLAGTAPNDVNNPNKNDVDGDGLWDNWELRFFGDVNIYDGSNDPDGDGLTNIEELDLGLHPVQVRVDKDQDGLPDVWELRWFSGFDMNDTNNPDGDCFTNLDEYELGLDPTSRMGDLNVDCNINLIDFELYASRWKDVDCNEPEWCGWADVDRDGKVDFFDLDLLCENWLRRLW